MQLWLMQGLSEKTLLHYKTFRPFMLRRLKSDVAKGLLPKTETLIMVGISKMQKKIIESYF